MTALTEVNLIGQDLSSFGKDFDRISVFINDTKKMDEIAKHIDKLTNGAFLRAINSKEFKEKTIGEILTLSFPGILKAKHLDIVKWSKLGIIDDARKAGVNLAKKFNNSRLLICLGSQKFSEDFLKGFLLRQYEFLNYKTNDSKTIGSVTPDKSTVMFKIFCTDEAALQQFIEGTEVSKPIMDDVLGSYTIYDLTKVKEG